jgi:hypothetical protein
VSGFMGGGGDGVWCAMEQQQGCGIWGDAIRQDRSFSLSACLFCFFSFLGESARKTGRQMVTEGCLAYVRRSDNSRWLQSKLQLPRRWFAVISDVARRSGWNLGVS